MDTYISNGSPSQSIVNRIEVGEDPMTDQAVNQLEKAFELGLAGLRDYLNQLAPEDREKVISTISDNVNRSQGLS
jgi:ribosome-binding protein aMBF1 (putative translation factor)